MPHKKKLFSKENSEKFLLLRGSPQAVNADGKTLPNLLVPVSKKYKPGTSFLTPSFAALSNLDPGDGIEEHNDNEGIVDDASTVDESNAAEVIEDLLSDMKQLKFSRLPKEFSTFDDEDGKYSKQDGPGNYQNSSENWKMFNEKFDRILEEYTDDKIGALDDDDDILHMQIASPEQCTHIDDHHEELELVLEDFDKSLKEKILNYVEDSADEKTVEIVTEKPLEYDCESILSTYSNKYNHPTVIKEEKIRRIRNTSHASHESESDDELHSKLLTNSSNIRKKDETPEERKERQRRFKEAKKLRRELKKQNKEAFKEEEKFQSLKKDQQQNAGMKLL